MPLGYFALRSFAWWHLGLRNGGLDGGGMVSKAHIIEFVSICLIAKIIKCCKLLPPFSPAPAPSTASDPAVEALISWVEKNRGVVSTILMLCGPTTKHGPVTGNLSAACVKTIPELAALGVGSELWLGETDDYNMAISLMKNPEATVNVLAQLGKENPGIVGFNFDLEVSKVYVVKMLGCKCSSP